MEGKVGQAHCCTSFGAGTWRPHGTTRNFSWHPCCHLSLQQAEQSAWRCQRIAPPAVEPGGTEGR
eukprot:2480503-Prorocentrum_lima.AAC.1